MYKLARKNCLFFVILKLADLPEVLFNISQKYTCKGSWMLLTYKLLLYKMSEHVLDIYQWIQSDLSHTYFLLLLSWTYSVLIRINSLV